MWIWYGRHTNDRKMCAVRYKDRIDASLLPPLVEEENVTDDGGADRHHTGEAKPSECAGTDQSGKVRRDGRSNVAYDSDNNGNKRDRSAAINICERRPNEGLDNFD